MKSMPKPEVNKRVCRIAAKRLLDCAVKKQREMTGWLLKSILAVY